MFPAEELDITRITSPALAERNDVIILELVSAPTNPTPAVVASEHESFCRARDMTGRARNRQAHLVHFCAINKSVYVRFSERPQFVHSRVQRLPNRLLLENTQGAFQVLLDASDL